MRNPGSTQNDMIWSYDYGTKNLTRIATSPYGSEFTSVDYYEIGKWAYLTAVVQHPYGESGELLPVVPCSPGKLSRQVTSCKWKLYTKQRDRVLLHPLDRVDASQQPAGRCCQMRTALRQSNSCDLNTCALSCGDRRSSSHACTKGLTTALSKWRIPLPPA